MLYDAIELDSRSSVPLYRQLYDGIRTRIGNGSTQVGEKMPSIRRLCEELGVSRTTVEQAYQQLCVEGYLVSRPQSGYYVEAAVRNDPPRPDVPQEESRNTAVRYDFGSRYVDIRRADIELWRKYVRAVLSREDIVSSYGHFQGEPALRRELTRYALQRGVSASPERIIVGAGVQPLLSLLCGMLEEKRQRVAMETPFFAQAERVFRDFRLDITAPAQDGDGVIPQSLCDSGAEILYLNPSHTESRGRPMPVNRRAALLEWATRTDSLIIEDDEGGALRFRTRPVPAMQGMDKAGRVVYLGSFSKLLMPSVRISYMVLPEEAAAFYRQRGAYYNQTSSKVEQLALADYMRDGHIERRLRRLRKVYADKSEQLVALLQEAFGEEAQIRLIETSLCVDLTLRCGMSTEELVEKAAANGLRIRPVPAAGEAEPEKEKARIRLRFAGIAPEDIRGGVALLREVSRL